MSKKIKIEVHSQSMDNTGPLKVWVFFQDEIICIRMEEDDIWPFLSMKQKHDFFDGQYEFWIPKYDIDVMIHKFYFPETNTTIMDAVSRYYENK